MSKIRWKFKKRYKTPGYYDLQRAYKIRDETGKTKKIVEGKRVFVPNRPAYDVMNGREVL